MKITGNYYGVIKVSKESMLLRLLLKYWGRRIFVLKDVMFLGKKYHIKIYHELQHFKQARKVLLHEYSENIKAYISNLQNNSSFPIESTIHHNSKSTTSSNESNSINVSNCSLIFGIDGNYQKPITSTETCLTISISDLIISEGPSFNLYQKPIFKKVLELARNV